MNTPAVSRSRAGEASIISLATRLAEAVIGRAEGSTQREHSKRSTQAGDPHGKVFEQSEECFLNAMFAVLAAPTARTAGRSAARRRPDSA